MWLSIMAVLIHASVAMLTYVNQRLPAVRHSHACCLMGVSGREREPNSERLNGSATLHHNRAHHPRTIACL